MIAVTGVLLCAAVWLKIGRGNHLERAKVGQIRVLRVEKLQMKWRKGIKGTEASELEEETHWVRE